MLVRILTGLLLIAIFLPLFIIGGTATYIMVGVVTAMSMYELTSMHSNNWSKLIRWTIIISFSAMSFLPLNAIAWGVLLACFLLIQLSVWNPSFTLNDALLYSTLGLFVSLIGGAVLYLGLDSGLYLIYIALVTFTVDTMAYFGGRFFGKHKFNPRVSPKKTWEGCITGFICGVCVALVFGYFYPEITFGIPGALISGIILSIAGQCGDLMFSLIKRNYNVKDFSSLLPGHGGMLDRIDSLIANIAMFMVFIQIMERLV